jgi:N-acetylmuramoyl-L-alanine amidase
MDESATLTEPQLVSPAEWNAAPTRFALPARGPLDHLVLHHTAFASSRIGGATLDAEARHMRQIQQWHLDRGWATVGYHFVLSPTGRIFRGRPVDRLGAHVLGHNVGTVGICLMGNFESERPTASALAALDLVRTRLVPGGAAVALLGHRDHRGHESSACPGRHLKRREPPSGGSRPTGTASR